MLQQEHLQSDETEDSEEELLVRTQSGDKERNFVNMSGSLQFSRKGLKPGFETSLGTYLDSQTVGYLRYSTSLG